METIVETYSLPVPVSNTDYELRHATHQGRDCIVLPVIMMVEGVHSGSQGPIFYPIEELGKIPEVWNGIPVTIDHPQAEESFVSANSPEIIDSRTVGRVYNTYIDGNKLKGEVWLDVEKLQNLSPKALADINAHAPIDVSVGVFNDREELVENAIFVNDRGEEEPYGIIARNPRPDHLALLPGGVGACSWTDGCGIRVNTENNEGMKSKSEMRVVTLTESQTVTDIVCHVTGGVIELVDAARRKMDSLDSESTIYFLQEVYDDFLVYETRSRVGGGKIYKQAYQFENGVVSLSGDPVEVSRKVEYVAVNTVETQPISNNQNKEVEMAEKCTPCIKAKADKLIANTATTWAEADRVFLESLEESQLDKMFPAEVPPPAKSPLTREELVEALSAISDDELPSLFNAERRERLEIGLNTYKEQRTEVVKAIKEGSVDSTWTDDELNAMSLGVLKKIAASVTTKSSTVYVTGGINNAAPKEGVAPMEVNF